jgi:hypothetical protein
MDTPIATIFMFDWTTDVIESVMEVVIIMFRDVEEVFVVSIKIMVGFNRFYTVYSILWIATYMHAYDIVPFSVIKISFVFFSISACVLVEG